MEKPVLSRTQRAWLQEIGIDARMLAHFSARPFAEPEPAATVQPVETVATVATPPTPATRMKAPAVSPMSSESQSSAAPRTRPDRPVSIGEVLQRAPIVAPPGVRAVTGSPSATRVDGNTLEALRAHAEACTACGLHEVRGQSVFGEGAVEAPQWMFIGEAPGEYDDSTGRPFQGRAGELLQAMLASVGITESAATYFTNVLKCRPMGNRIPDAQEVAACMPLLRRQITLLRPACLVALGRVPAGALLGGSEELEALRGRVHEYLDEDGRKIPLVVTHHPMALLLHAHLKAEAWRDLNLLPGLPQ